MALCHSCCDWLGTTSQGDAPSRIPPSPSSEMLHRLAVTHVTECGWGAVGVREQPTPPRGAFYHWYVVKNSCASLSVVFIVVFMFLCTIHPLLVPVRPLPRPCHQRCHCLEAKPVGSGGQRSDEASSASLALGPTLTLTSPTSPGLAISYRTSEQEGYLDVVKSSPPPLY